MAKITRIPIGQTPDQEAKNQGTILKRLEKERYVTPKYSVGIVTSIVDRELDPKNQTDIKDVLIVLPFSYDPKLKQAVPPPDDKKSFDEGHESSEYYTIGVRRDFDLKEAVKVGDIIEVEIVSNEITKRNNIDGYYRSTINANKTPFWKEIDRTRVALKRLFNGNPNSLLGHFAGSSVPSLEPEDIDKTMEEKIKNKKLVEAWRYGKKIADIEVINLQGKQVEVNTARKFLEMSEAAKRDGIYLKITSGYRSMNSQISIYNKRYEPDYAGTGNCTRQGKGEKDESGSVVKSRFVSDDGVAAYPGCSNHQSGIAIDIEAKTRPEVFRWLSTNAQRFGFKNTVPSEPWHWEYRG